MPEVPVCGKIGTDNTVTVSLKWFAVDPETGPPQSDRQIVKGWLWISVTDQRIPAFEQVVGWGVKSLEVAGLAKGNTYIWQVITVYPDDFEASSDESWFTTPSGGEPPPNGEPPPEGGFKVPLLLIGVAAGGAVLYFISKSPGSKIPPQVAETALLLPP